MHLRAESGKEITFANSWQLLGKGLQSRALYTLKYGEQVSKKQATLWAEKEFPEWASLIESALLWREDWRDENVDHDAMFEDMLRFVCFAIRECEG